MANNEAYNSLPEELKHGTDANKQWQQKQQDEGYRDFLNAYPNKKSEWASLYKENLTFPMTLESRNKLLAAFSQKLGCDLSKWKVNSFTDEQWEKYWNSFPQGHYIRNLRYKIYYLAYGDDGQEKPRFQSEHEKALQNTVMPGFGDQLGQMSYMRRKPKLFQYQSPTTIGSMPASDINLFRPREIANKLHRLEQKGILTDNDIAAHFGSPEHFASQLGGLLIAWNQGLFDEKEVKAMEYLLAKLASHYGIDGNSIQSSPEQQTNVTNDQLQSRDVASPQSNREIETSTAKFSLEKILKRPKEKDGSGSTQTKLKSFQVELLPEEYATVKREIAEGRANKITQELQKELGVKSVFFAPYKNTQNNRSYIVVRQAL